MPRARAPTWSPLPGHRLLKGRAGHTATLVEKKLLVLGGRSGNEFFNDLWEFDLERKRWNLIQKNTPLKARAYHTATLIGGNQLWVIGGSDISTIHGDVHVLDTDSYEWTSPVTQGPFAGRMRGTHAAIQHPVESKGILVFGGYGGLNSQWLRDMAILRTDTLVWEELQPRGVIPSARGYHTLTAFGIHVVLFGGKGDNGIIPSSSISVYDAMLNRWIAPNLKGTSPTSRSNHAAALINDDLIVIHGGRNGSERLNDICLLQICSPPVAGCADSLSWHIIEEQKSKAKMKGTPVKSRWPSGRSAHTLVGDDSSLYLFGGYGGSGLNFNDIFVIHNFQQVAAVKGRLTGAPPRSVDKVTSVRRRSEYDFQDNDGWRSTKQPRGRSRPSVKSVPDRAIHVLDSDEDMSMDDAPANFEHIVGDNDRRRIGTPGTTLRPPIEENVQVERAAELNFSVMTNAKKASERDQYAQGSLQQVVDSLKAELTGLKAEVNGKNLLELELRASKAALQQNIQLLQTQVEEGNQKIVLQKNEMERLKVEAHDLSIQVDKKEQQINETDHNLKRAEQKSENLSKALEQSKALICKTSEELDGCRLRVHNLEGELERQMHEIQQMRQSHERETALCRKSIVESKEQMALLSNELDASKESKQALQETLERLSKNVERANGKITGLEKEKEKLSHANSMLLAEQVHLIEAKERAEALVDRVKGELQVANSVIERNNVEISQMKENSDQAKEHIQSTHASLMKREEEIKSLLSDNNKLRILVKEVEDFENAQVRSVQNHIEKLRCAREFGPRP